MATKKATIKAEWDEDLENKIEKKVKDWGKSCGKNSVSSNAGAGAIYCLGLLGAIVYFIQTATSFWDGAFGFLQALVWPAFVVYRLLQFLNL